MQKKRLSGTFFSPWDRRLNCSEFRSKQDAPSTYLTHPAPMAGFTVTDSPGFSPDSVFRFPAGDGASAILLSCYTSLPMPEQV